MNENGERKRKRNYIHIHTRQFRIIWLANKGLIYWSWCNGNWAKKKNICLIAISTGGAGMENWFISIFLYIKCDIVESWNETRMNQQKQERKKTEKSNKVSYIFFSLHLRHSVLLLVTDIKRKKKWKKKKIYIKQFRIDKLSSKFWFWLLL